MKFKINSGEFRHPISIFKKEQIQDDDDGIPQDEDIEVLSTRAKITNVKNDEIEIAQGSGSNTIRNFYIRYISNIEIEKDFEIEFQNKRYNISSCDDIENRQRILVLKGQLIE